MSAPVVDRRTHLDADGAAAVLALADRAAAQDGVQPLNEAARIALTQPVEAPTLHLGTTDDGGLVGHLMAERVDDTWQAELVVEPHHRRRGLGTTLLAAFLDGTPADDVAQVWSHGDLPGAAPLAHRAGLAPVRTLLRLSRDGVGPVDEPAVPGDVRVRTFRPGLDEEALLRVNARAFASHPEQGRMDSADLTARMRGSWFDPEGLFLVEDAADGRLLGFHWTKVEDGVGEVYVLGIDPDAQGRRLGTFLTALGLHHLTVRHGLDRVDLFVEGDNVPALAVYHRIGFTEVSRDVLYRR